MTTCDRIAAEIDGTGLSFTVDGAEGCECFSFRQIDAGFTTGLALGTFNFQESLAFIKGWNAAKGLPNRIKADLTFRME